MKNALAAATGFLLAASTALAGIADTWDVTADFSNSNGNPNGVWTYGWYSTDFTQFTPMTPYAGGNGSPGWSGHLGGDGTPVVYRNTGGEGVPFGVPLNWFALHPGPSGQAAVARWTCPTGVTGQAGIAGEFLAGDSGVMQVGVRIDGVEVFHATDHGPFALCEAVEPGTVVEFVVYGAYFNGNTPLRATISTRRCGADIGAAGGTPTLCGDGQLDNNDFIVFITYFFNASPRADLGQTGGLPGSDGQFDNNDFIAFINLFFEGC
ncbi:MAG: GC-type dockerin domain-anchored protein [Phycisphaerales bacterium]